MKATSVENYLSDGIYDGKQKFAKFVKDVRWREIQKDYSPREI